VFLTYTKFHTEGEKKDGHRRKREDFSFFNTGQRVNNRVRTGPTKIYCKKEGDRRAWGIKAGKWGGGKKGKLSKNNVGWGVLWPTLKGNPEVRLILPLHSGRIKYSNHLVVFQRGGKW